MPKLPDVMKDLNKGFQTVKHSPVAGEARARQRGPTFSEKL
jgi:hypothetical protein